MKKDSKKENNAFCEKCLLYRNEKVKGVFYAVDGEGKEVLECPQCGHKFRKDGKPIQPY